MFAATLRDHALDFALWYKNALPNAHSAQLLCFDKSARGERRNRKSEGRFFN
jgi:hypothetical protein